MVSTKVRLLLLLLLLLTMMIMTMVSTYLDSVPVMARTARQQAPASAQITIINMVIRMHCENPISDRPKRRKMLNNSIRFITSDGCSGFLTSWDIVVEVPDDRRIVSLSLKSAS
jgi:hypothetical protein